MHQVDISEVQIVPIRPKDGLVGFASCLFNHQLSLNNIGIYLRPDGQTIRLVYPETVLPNAKRLNTYFPINRETGEAIREAISRKYEELTSKLGKT